ncbi:type II secretion system F family protein [soil metagenome]
MSEPMTEATWLPIVLAVALGAVGALLAWQLSSAVAEVPPEDRTWRDRAPRVFRLVWHPIQWLAYYLGTWLPIGYRQSTIQRLRLAGLDYALAPEQFVAARVIAAMLGAAVAGWMALSFNVPAATLAMPAGAFGYLFPSIWLRDQIQLRRRQTLKALPFFLDVITLCVEAGLNLTGAIQQAVDKGPVGPLRDELARILRDVRAGKPRTDALRTFADRMSEPAITNLVSALIQAESLGMNMGPILRAQADQRRAERFARAEKMAMEAPVKMLFPLIAFIFPCTFIVLAFPIVQKFLRMGF